MDSKISIETKKIATAEQRADYYANCLTIEFPKDSGELIAYDEAAKFYNSYHAVDDEEKATYLKQEMKRVKAEAHEMFKENVAVKDTANNLLTDEELKKIFS